MTRILLVRDNRYKKNFGCRATSLALTQVLSNSGVVNSLPAYHDIHKKLPIKSLEDVVGENAQIAAMKLIDGRCDSAEASDVVSTLESHDVIVINLEGCGIFCDPYRRDLAFVNMIIWASKILEKKVIIANGMLSDCPQTGRNSLAVKEVVNGFNMADAVALRDKASKKIADEIGVQSAQYIPDALFSWANTYHRFFESKFEVFPEIFAPWPEEQNYFLGQRLPERYICLSAASFHPFKSVSHYGKFFCVLIDRIKKAFNDYSLILVSPGGDYFLKNLAIEKDCFYLEGSGNILLNAYILARTHLYISGRYHPAIMASFNGAPSVFLESNSHKTNSLQKILGYSDVKEHAIYLDEDATANIIADAKSKLLNKELMFNIKNSVSINAHDANKLNAVLADII